MTVQLAIQQLEIPEGQRLRLRHINWQEFEAILEELGEHRASRVAYFNGTLEVRMPLPEHEVDKELIGDLVKLILDTLELDFECFGSTTFKRQDMKSGIEPDTCFYIQNHSQMVGKRRVDLTVDPPPDLAIEIDVTSMTQLAAYEALKVAELWCYCDRKLSIYTLQGDRYIETTVSPTLPTLALGSEIPRFVEIAIAEGRGRAMKACRQWLASA
ncbi:MAG: Uma2 family endonuclease [Leptolyngbyaceae bacterium]|nr:Uma2 family endonuclease [Leptolyngbyaceae bacterium]